MVSTWNLASRVADPFAKLHGDFFFLGLRRAFSVPPPASASNREQEEKRRGTLHVVKPYAFFPGHKLHHSFIHSIALTVCLVDTVSSVPFFASVSTASPPKTPVVCHHRAVSWPRLPIYLVTPLISRPSQAIAAAVPWAISISRRRPPPNNTFAAAILPDYHPPGPILTPLAPDALTHQPRQRSRRVQAAPRAGSAIPWPITCSRVTYDTLRTLRAPTQSVHRNRPPHFLLPKKTRLHGTHRPRRQSLTTDR